MVTAELRIDRDLIRRLVAEQFPHWAHLSVESVQPGGHDNRTFHLGDSMSVRVPSAQAYVARLLTEQDWLPRLAPRLAVPIPQPLALGRPGHGLPWPWSIRDWLVGEVATRTSIGDGVRFAGDLAAFLRGLQGLAPQGGPPPGPENFFRGGDLGVYDAETRAGLEQLEFGDKRRALLQLWEDALTTPWCGSPVWVHGDVAAGNLLVRDGALYGVIDFGQMAVGDPACDLTAAWTLFEGRARGGVPQGARLGGGHLGAGARLGPVEGAVPARIGAAGRRRRRPRPGDRGSALQIGLRHDDRCPRRGSRKAPVSGSREGPSGPGRRWRGFSPCAGVP